MFGHIADSKRHIDTQQHVIITHIFYNHISIALVHAGTIALC